MEFCTLSVLSDNPEYCQKALAALNKLESISTQSGHYHSLINYSGYPHNKITLGGLGDSFYEVIFLKMKKMDFERKI